MPITSPVERISGPRTESTPVPSRRLKRFQGRTASFTETPFATPSPARGRIEEVRSSAIVTPVEMRAAAFARGLPVALLTNGTVRDARGFASMT